MATVTNTYARAFVDVVIDRKLDAARTLAEVQSIAGMVASSKDLKLHQFRPMRSENCWTRLSRKRNFRARFAT
jgi:hypothetical protein